MYNDKLKIFVRYNGGSGGHFISLMILSLTKQVNMIEKNSGHANAPDFMIHHNFNDQWSQKGHRLFRTVTDSDSKISLASRIQYIKSKFKFYPTEDLLYIVHTHADDPRPLIDAFDNTRLVNITHTEEDIPQLSYNFITKFLMSNFSDPVNRQNFLGNFRWVQRKYNRLLDVSPESVVLHSDVRLITYIHSLRKHRMIPHEFPDILKSKIFNIKFSDIMNKNIISQLDDLISFLGITVTEERKRATIQMIHSYVDNQVVIPFNIKIDSYS